MLDDSHGSRESHRYGLGSDERKQSSSYGPSSSQHVVKEEFGVPNSIVGLVIGKGGENLKRIEAASGARIQFGPGRHLYTHSRGRMKI
jgi:far upstream element-binding protein